MAKAGRPKKGSNGLPNWFDIEKYRQAITYAAAEWYQQLAFRLFVQNCLLDEDLPYHLGKEWADLLMADPHITVARLEDAYPVLMTHEYDEEEIVLRGTPGDELINEISLYVEPACGVQAATNADMMVAPESFPKLIRTRLPKKASQETKMDWYSQYHAPFVSKEFSINDDRRFIRVDLSLPDAILKNKFAEYLKSQRKNMKEAIGPFFKNQDFNGWYNSGVLPYLDLQLWEIKTKQTFQWSAFANALNTITDFPVGSEDACRKAAKAHAQKLMDVQTTRILNFQAIKEQSEGRKKSGKLIVK